MKSTARTGSLTELNSREAVEHFRKAAKDFTKRATRSVTSARKVLVDEGIYTKNGNLSKNYK